MVLAPQHQCKDCNLLESLKTAEIAGGDVVARQNFRDFVGSISDILAVCISNRIIDQETLQLFFTALKVFQRMPPLKNLQWLKTSIVNFIVFVQQFPNPVFAEILTIRDLEDVALTYKDDNLHSTVQNIINKTGPILYEKRGENCPTAHTPLFYRSVKDVTELHLTSCSFGFRLSKEDPLRFFAHSVFLKATRLDYCRHISN